MVSVYSDGRLPFKLWCEYHQTRNTQSNTITNFFFICSVRPVLCCSNAFQTVVRVPPNQEHTVKHDLNFFFFICGVRPVLCCSKALDAQRQLVTLNNIALHNKTCCHNTLVMQRNYSVTNFNSDFSEESVAP